MSRPLTIAEINGSPDAAQIAARADQAYAFIGEKVEVGVHYHCVYNKIEHFYICIRDNIEELLKDWPLEEYPFLFQSLYEIVKDVPFNNPVVADPRAVHANEIVNEFHSFRWRAILLRYKEGEKYNPQENEKIVAVGHKIEEYMIANKESGERVPYYFLKHMVQGLSSGEIALLFIFMVELEETTLKNIFTFEKTSWSDIARSHSQFPSNSDMSGMYEYYDNETSFETHRFEQSTLKLFLQSLAEFETTVFEKEHIGREFPDCGRRSRKIHV